ncbi:MAG: carboxylating nicotinate-nucleotide diphosphorylase [Gammaproteobacteria bacterium]|nr:carboxylating nicotinate-nucleotide diphosphorylase [Gammaproteobacteria bacterium]
MQKLKLPDDLTKVVKTALREDIGPGDITASLIAPGIQASARVLVRESAILCGSPWFNEVFNQIDDSVKLEWLAEEGDKISPGQTVCKLSGDATSLLSGERTALNFLQTLSGTATATRKFADAVAEFGVRILDTRKTIPGLRTAQKYAVRIGGGTNHRLGLYDGVLVKENHQYISQSTKSIVDQMGRRHIKVNLVEVEIEKLDELENAIASGANRVMLDNFSVSDIEAAVRHNNRRVELEASGNVDLDSIQAIAATGVDFISTGAITKHLQAIDYSMLFDSED